MGVMVGDAVLPRPPKKSSRPQSSVRSSPRYTGVPWKAPSNVQSAPPAFLPRMVRAPPSITSPSRAAPVTVALRRGGGRAGGPRGGGGAGAAGAGAASGGGGVGWGGGGAGGLGGVHPQLPPVPARLAVGDVRRPADVGRVG